MFCANGAGCLADGSGTVDVVDGRTFVVVWQEVAIGDCDLFLQS